MATTTRLFRWGGYYRIGIEQIDREHEELAGLLNELYDAWQKGAPRPELVKHLRGLIKATTKHFRAEEKIMAEAGYPGLKSHKVEHKFLTNHVGELLEGLEAGTAEFSDSIMSYLKDWIRDHMLISDQRMGEYLTTQGRSS